MPDQLEAQHSSNLKPVEKYNHGEWACIPQRGGTLRRACHSQWQLRDVDPQISHRDRYALLSIRVRPVAREVGGFSTLR